MLQVEVCFLRLPPGFPAVPLYFNLSPVGPCPSQNRACAIYAHGSSDSHSPSIEGYAQQFRFHRFSASVFGRCFSTLLDHLSSPSLQRHYPPSLVLLDDPTPCRRFCLSPFVRLFGILSSMISGKQRQGLPGCRVVSMSRMPWSPTPRKRHILAFPAVLILTSVGMNTSSFLLRVLRGSIPSAFRLTACVLAGLRLEASITAAFPRSRYSVAG